MEMSVANTTNLVLPIAPECTRNDRQPQDRSDCYTNLELCLPHLSGRILNKDNSLATKSFRATCQGGPMQYHSEKSNRHGSMSTKKALISAVTTASLTQCCD